MAAIRSSIKYGRIENRKRTKIRKKSDTPFHLGKGLRRGGGGGGETTDLRRVWRIEKGKKYEVRVPSPLN